MTTRIYICGAHATGKTTLARHIAKATGLPMLHEVARQVLAEREMSFETLRCNLDTVNEYQRAVFERQLEVEKHAPKGFVSDRAFCNLAYAARHSQILHDVLSLPEMDAYFNTMREGALVLYTRPDPVFLAADGTREKLSWDEVVRIDGMIDFILAWQRIPAIGIAETGMRDRVRTAMTAVNLYLRRRGTDSVDPSRLTRRPASTTPFPF